MSFYSSASISHGFYWDRTRSSGSNQQCAAFSGWITIPADSSYRRYIHHRGFNPASNVAFSLQLTQASNGRLYLAEGPGDQLSDSRVAPVIATGQLIHVFGWGVQSGDAPRLWVDGVEAPFGSAPLSLTIGGGVNRLSVGFRSDLASPGKGDFSEIAYWVLDEAVFDAPTDDIVRAIMAGAPPQIYQPDYLEIIAPFQSALQPAIYTGSSITGRTQSGTPTQGTQHGRISGRDVIWVPSAGGAATPTDINANTDTLALTEYPATVVGGDVTDPELTGASATATSATTADLEVNSNEATGTWYWIVSTTAVTPSVSDVQTGQEGGGTAAPESGSGAVSAVGALTATATGLPPDTTLYAYFQHQDAAGNDSAVVGSGAFTTPSAGTNVAATADALALTEQPAAITLDTEVATASDALAITEQPAAITLDTEVATAPDVLAITEQPAAITLDTEVATAPDTLALTEQPAAITLDTEVATAPDTLAITEQPAAVTVDTEVATAPDTLALTEQPAAITLDTEVATAPDTLTLITYPAALNNDTAVTTAPDTLALTEQPAAVTVDTVVATAPVTIALTEQPATIALGVAITTAPDALALTEQPATVTQDVAVATVPDTLALTTYPAALNDDTKVTTTPDALALTELPAAVTIDTEVATAPDALALTTYPATLLSGAVVEATPDTLALTTHPAAIGRDVAVTTNPAAFTLTLYSAGVAARIKVVGTPYPVYATQEAPHPVYASQDEPYPVYSHKPYPVYHRKQLLATRW